MRPAATCEVWLGGVRVADTVPALAAGHVTALDKLTVTWGRDGQHDQPKPATCTVALLDPTPDGQILDQLHVGTDLQVWAAGQIPGGGDEQWGDNTFDPSQSTFTGWADGAPPLRSLATGNQAKVTVVNGQLRMDRSAKYPSPAVFVPPRPFSPSNELPDAWDDIAKASSGEQWLLRARVRIPEGMTANLGYQRYAGPYYANLGVGLGPTFTGTGEWQTVELEQVVDGAGWLGVVVWGDDPWSGRRWSDQTDTWSADTRTWDVADLDVGIYLDDLEVRPPSGSAARRSLVFSGTVSDVDVEPGGDGASTRVSLIAADLAADLGNRVIGDPPWPVQTAKIRADRIAELAGISPRVRFGPGIDQLALSYRDVDAQSGHALLADVAQSVGGVLWVGTHAVTGPYLYVENPAARDPVRRLALSAGQIVVVGSTAGDVTILSACDLIRDPVRWRQDSGDVVTVAAVSWQEQTVDDKGQPKPTTRTETVTSAAGVARFGTRRLSVTTDLVAAVDAATMAGRLLALADDVAWRMDGLTLDTGRTLDQLDTVDDATRARALFALLDGTSRLGRAVTLVDMPAYAPRGAESSAYVEGGRYTFTRGAWQLELNTTPAARQGGTARWSQLPAAWTWQQTGDLTWTDLYGAAAPA